MKAGLPYSLLLISWAVLALVLMPGASAQAQENPEADAIYVKQYVQLTMREGVRDPVPGYAAGLAYLFSHGDGNAAYCSDKRLTKIECRPMTLTLKNTGPRYVSLDFNLDCDGPKIGFQFEQKGHWTDVTSSERDVVVCGGMNEPRVLSPGGETVYPMRIHWDKINKVPAGTYSVRAKWLVIWYSKNGALSVVYSNAVTMTQPPLDPALKQYSDPKVGLSFAIPRDWIGGLPVNQAGGGMAGLQAPAGGWPPASPYAGTSLIAITVSYNAKPSNGLGCYGSGPGPFGEESILTGEDWSNGSNVRLYKTALGSRCFVLETRLEFAPGGAKRAFTAEEKERVTRLLRDVVWSVDLAGPVQ